MQLSTYLSGEIVVSVAGTIDTRAENVLVASLIQRSVSECSASATVDLFEFLSFN